MYGVDINDRDWIVGNAYISRLMAHPVLWKPGAHVRDLGLPPGYATGCASRLNERGQVLVTFERPVAPKGSWIGVLFIWSDVEGFVELPRPEGFDDLMAMALNDLGHVLLSATHRA